MTEGQVVMTDNPAYSFVGVDEKTLQGGAITEWSSICEKINLSKLVFSILESQAPTNKVVFPFHFLRSMLCC